MVDSANQSVNELKVSLAQTREEGEEARRLLADAESELQDRDADEAQRLQHLKYAVSWLIISSLLEMCKLVVLCMFDVRHAVHAPCMHYLLLTCANIMVGSAEEEQAGPLAFPHMPLHPGQLSWGSLVLHEALHSIMPTIVHGI